MRQLILYSYDNEEITTKANDVSQKVNQSNLLRKKVTVELIYKDI